MTDQHPTIVPPLELKRQWIENNPETAAYACEIWLIDRAAQWGYEQRGEVNEAELQQARDEELEACCELLKQKGVPAWSLLRSHRRPKPPSLKEQALEALDDFSKMSETLYSSYDPPEEIYSDQVNIIRQALETLPNKC